MIQVNRSTQRSPNRFVRPDYEALLDVSNVPLDEYASKSVVESDCPLGVEGIRRSAPRVGRDVEQRDRARHLVVFTRQFDSQRRWHLRCLRGHVVVLTHVMFCFGLRWHLGDARSQVFLWLFRSVSDFDHDGL